MSEKYDQVRSHPRVFKSASQSGISSRGRSVASSIMGPPNTGIGIGSISNPGNRRTGTSSVTSGSGRVSRDRERKISDKRTTGHARESKASAVLDEATRMNSDVCKRMDPSFLKIIKVASQVALYEYDCSSEKWTSVGINGCLFFYERSQLPTYGLFILNRSNLNNFVQLLTPDIEIQVVMPHILMNNREVIRCLWFYKESECIQLAGDICKKLGISLSLPPPSGDEAAESGDRLARDSSPTESQSDVTVPGAVEAGSQLLSLLCNYKPTLDEPAPVVKEKESGSSRQHLREQHSVESNPPECKEISMLREELGNIMKSSRHEEKGETRPKITDKIDKGNAISNPKAVKSVCDNWSPDVRQGFQAVPNLFSSKIEVPVLQFQTQEESTAPVSAYSTSTAKGPLPNLPALSRQRHPTPATPPNTLDSLGEELRATLGISNKRADTVNWMSDGNCSFDKTSKLKDVAISGLPGHNSNNKNANWEGSGHEASDSSTHNNDNEEGDAEGLRDAEELDRDNREQYERRKQEIFERERRDAAVQALGRQRDFVDDVTQNYLSSSHHHMDDNFGSNSQGDFGSRFILNKQQMVQAMTYLLKTDADFTDKLHKAYLSSLNEGY